MHCKQYIGPKLIKNILYALWIQERDTFRTKKSNFSTHSLIWVHFKTVHYISQPIFSLFSHLKNEVLNLVIELCSAHKLFQKYFTRFFKIVTHSFVAIELLTFFNNAKFHFYCSIDLSLFWLHKWYSPSRRGLYIYFKHLLQLFYWYFLIDPFLLREYHLFIQNTESSLEK